MSDYRRELLKAGLKHDRARARAVEAEIERDDVIRAAHHEGRMTVRAIAGVLGISHQRVGQIVKQDQREG